jgi:hypothetical protein
VTVFFCYDDIRHPEMLGWGCSKVKEGERSSHAKGCQNPQVEYENHYSSKEVRINVLAAKPPDVHRN